MVIDTSALLAILQNEPERRAFNEAIEAAETRLLSAASFVEISMIVESRYGADGMRDLDLFIAKAQLELVAVDVEQAHLARQAFRNFGKGRHPAGLNFGDCFSYALARSVARRFFTKERILAGVTSRVIRPVAEERDSSLGDWRLEPVRYRLGARDVENLRRAMANRRSPGRLRGSVSATHCPEQRQGKHYSCRQTSCRANGMFSLQWVVNGPVAYTFDARLPPGQAKRAATDTGSPSTTWPLRGAQK